MVLGTIQASGWAWWVIVIAAFLLWKWLDGLTSDSKSEDTKSTSTPPKPGVQSSCWLCDGTGSRPVGGVCPICKGTGTCPPVRSSSYSGAEDSEHFEPEPDAFDDDGAGDITDGSAIRALLIQLAFEELGVDPDAHWEEVQRAYRGLCKQYHPDVVASRDYPPHVVKLMENKFKSITDAYNLLKENRASS